ncbi:MAG: nuclear transport factor 2 family protein [Candidatus Parcubacteria bacterium]|nr:nuclear transport factor 2 family protein [Burkholderiales bacterium]
MTAAFPELLQITHRFYYYLEERRYKDLVSLMRADGVWHRQGKALKGHAQVLEALEQRTATMLIRHVVTNAFLDTESDSEATLIAYMTVYRHDDGSARKPPVAIDGPYRIMLVKKRFVREGGRWLIAESSGSAEFEFRGAK